MAPASHDPSGPVFSSLCHQNRQTAHQHALQTLSSSWMIKLPNRPLDTNLKAWWSLSGSNRRPSACKADALPAELRPLACGVPAIVRHHEVVGPGRFELPTSPLSGVRSNQLSYGPDPMNRFMIPAPAEVVSSAQSRTRNKRAPGERTIIQ